MTPFEALNAVRVEIVAHIRQVRDDLRAIADAAYADSKRRGFGLNPAEDLQRRVEAKVRMKDARLIADAFDTLATELEEDFEINVQDLDGGEVALGRRPFDEQLVVRCRGCHALYVFHEDAPHVCPPAKERSL